MQATKRRENGVEKEVRSKTGTLSPGNPAYAVHREDACKLNFEKPSGNFRAKPVLEVSESKDTSRSGSGTMQGDTAASLGQYRCR